MDEYEKQRSFGKLTSADLEDGTRSLPQFANANSKVNTNPVQIDFKDVSYSITVGSGKKVKNKIILKNLSGKLVPGTIGPIPFLYAQCKSCL